MVPGASLSARAAPAAVEAEAFRSGVVPGRIWGLCGGARVSVAARRVGVQRRLEVLEDDGDSGLGRRGRR